MVNDVRLFLFILLAIIIGWLLGRQKRWSFGHHKGLELTQPSYKGLNYLIDERADGALDSFIQSLDVNNETLETHLAVGNLMRRKGEVERAIRIHQNLLARPVLTKEQLHQAHLELARDYISAGLLDRAESLLLDLSEEAPELKDVAIGHLLEIYQDEKEWLKAVKTAKKLLPKKGLLKPKQAAKKTVSRALAHFYCELAEQQIRKNGMREARAFLKEALSHDGNCVRASLIKGQVESQTGHYDKAIKAYRAVFQQNPSFLPEIIKPLEECYRQLNKSEDYYTFLQQCIDCFPSSASLLALLEWIKAQKGHDEAVSFIKAELRRHPSLRGLSKLVELNLTETTGKEKEDMELVLFLIKQLLEDKPSYQCQHCGFSGKHLHWLCPGCKQWGEVEYIRGVEGD